MAKVFMYIGLHSREETKHYFEGESAHLIEFPPFYFSVRNISDFLFVCFCKQNHFDKVTYPSLGANSVRLQQAPIDKGDKILMTEFSPLQVNPFL